MRFTQVRYVGAAIVSGLFLNMAAVAADSKKPHATPVPKVNTAQVIELEAKLVDGKKSWVPAAVTAHPGKIVFRLKNTFPEPHGFNIAKVLATPMVVQANATTDVPVDIATAGTYELTCQLHPAHVKAVLTVK